MLTGEIAIQWLPCRKLLRSLLGVTQVSEPTGHRARLLLERTCHSFLSSVFDQLRNEGTLFFNLEKALKKL